MAGTSVRVLGGGELRRLARDLRRQGDRDRAKQMSQELREIGKELLPPIRAAIRGLPSQNQNRRRGRPSTRAQMARSVTLQLRTTGNRAGLSVFMNPKKLPDGKKSLPGYFERVPGKERLRHPTFGRAPWVNQLVPIQGYFTRNVRDAQDSLRDRAQRVLERAARDLEDG